MRELKRSYLVEIDGVPMPDPITYELPLDDLDSSDSSLSESGVQIRNRVRAFVSQLHLGWRVGGADATKVLLASKPDRVTVRFFDPTIDPGSGAYDPSQGLYSTKYMFVQSRSCSLVHLGDTNERESNLWDISFTYVLYSSIQRYSMTWFIPMRSATLLTFRCSFGTSSHACTLNALV